MRVLLLALVTLLASGCFFGGDDDDGEEIGCDPAEAGDESACLIGSPTVTATGTSASDGPTPPATTPTVEATPATGDSELFAGLQQDRLILGSPEAQVELTIYEDFQCPFCQRFTQEMLPRLIEDYVRPGRIRIVFHQVAAIGNESIWASLAAECAADQGLFWPYYNTLYANQGRENSGVFAKARLKAFASLVGVDQPTFDACLDDEVHLEAVEASTQAAFDRGLTAVPAFAVGDRFVQGSQPYEIMAGQIDSQLNQ